MTPQPRGFNFEVETRGQCRHTKHRHGWWCRRCLRAILPGGDAIHHGRGNWEVVVGPVSGYGGVETHAWQAAIEQCMMSGEWLRLVWSGAAEAARV